MRVSTNEQSTDLQYREISQYVEGRGWTDVTIYEDSGKSGTNANRPELKRMLKDARERRLDAIVCWKLDRLFRSLRDLIAVLQELGELGVAFVSLKDNLDLTTSAGRLMAHLLGAFAEFEASLIRERVCAGLANARAKGTKLGRPRRRDDKQIQMLRKSGLSLRQIASKLQVSKSTVQVALATVQKTPFSEREIAQ